MTQHLLDRVCELADEIRRRRAKRQRLLLMLDVANRERATVELTVTGTTTTHPLSILPNDGRDLMSVVARHLEVAIRAEEDALAAMELPTVQ
jgi:hypothetical protein